MKWLLVIAMLAVGCKDKSENQRVGPGGPSAPGEGVGKQSVKEAMTLLCDAVEKSGASGPEKNRLVAVWIEENVTHPKVLDMMRDMATMDRKAAYQRVREMARKHGIERCAFAEDVP